MPPDALVVLPLCAAYLLFCLAHPRAREGLLGVWGAA